jgi:hypothetical protein
MSKANLSESTVLVSYSISRWSGYRYDRKVTDEVHKANEAASDTGSYNKRLLPKGSTAKIDSVVNAARDYHRTHTLPWLDDGVRILPAAKYMEYAERMKDYRQEFEQEAKAFLLEYPKLVKQQKTRLGKMFNETDYPAAKELADWYAWNLVTFPFPDARDFRVGELVPDMATVKADLQKRMDAIWEEALGDVGTRIADVVGRMKDRLKAYKPGKPGKRAEGTFKDSLVDNVRELAEILPSFNLTGDPKFTKIIEQMQKDLCKHDAEVLREDDTIRKKVAASADSILTAVSDFIA